MNFSILLEYLGSIMFWLDRDRVHVHIAPQSLSEEVLNLNEVPGRLLARFRTFREHKIDDHDLVFDEIVKIDDLAVLGSQQDLRMLLRRLIFRPSSRSIVN